MSSQSRSVSESTPGRRALRVAIWRSMTALAVTVGLVAAVDAGARILGPALILVGAYWGVRALTDWWHHLDEGWFLAEVVLVSIGWALLAGAFATAQFLVFSFAPDAFYVDADYAKLVSPRYVADWGRDSARAAASLADLDRVDHALNTGAPPALVLDSLYPLAGGATGQVTERCEDQLPLEKCPWQVTVVPVSGAKPIEFPIAPPEGDRRRLSLSELDRQLRQEIARLQGEVREQAKRMSNPAAFVQPRIVDFLYDTGVAFSGNDAGVFVPISVLARICKVIEFLASLLLFGIVVSRVSAAGARATRR